MDTRPVPAADVLKSGGYSKIEVEGKMRVSKVVWNDRQKARRKSVSKKS